MDGYREKLAHWQDESQLMFGESNDFMNKLLTDIAHAGYDEKIVQEVMQTFCAFDVGITEVADYWCPENVTASQLDGYYEELQRYVLSMFSENAQYVVHKIMATMENETGICDHKDYVKDMVREKTVRLTIRRINRARASSSFCYHDLEQIAERSLSELRSLANEFSAGDCAMVGEVEQFFKSKLQIFKDMSEEELREAIETDIIMVLQSERFGELMQRWGDEYGQIFHKTQGKQGRKLRKLIRKQVRKSEVLKTAFAPPNFTVGRVAIAAISEMVEKIEDFSKSDVKIHRLITKEVARLQKKKSWKGTRKLMMKLQKAFDKEPESVEELYYLFKAKSNFFEQMVERYGSFIPGALDKIGHWYHLDGHPMFEEAKKFLNLWAVENLDEWQVKQMEHVIV